MDMVWLALPNNSLLPKRCFDCGSARDVEIKGEDGDCEEHLAEGSMIVFMLPCRTRNKQHAEPACTACLTLTADFPFSYEMNLCKASLGKLVRHGKLHLRPQPATQAQPESCTTIRPCVTMRHTHVQCLLGCRLPLKKGTSSPFQLVAFNQ